MIFPRCPLIRLLRATTARNSAPKHAIHDWSIRLKHVLCPATLHLLCELLTHRRQKLGLLVVIKRATGYLVRFQVDRKGSPSVRTLRPALIELASESLYLAV